MILCRYRRGHFSSFNCRRRDSYRRCLTFSLATTMFSIITSHRSIDECGSTSRLEQIFSFFMHQRVKSKYCKDKPTDSGEKSLMAKISPPHLREAHLWIFKITDDQPSPPSVEIPLDRQSPKRRQEFISSRVALHKILESYQLSEESIQNGDYKTSLSHSHDWGVWLISPSSHIGVDLQKKISKQQLARIVARQYGQRTRITPDWNEDLCFRLWTLFEAYFKSKQDFLKLGQITPAHLRGLRGNKNELSLGDKKIFFSSFLNNQYQICSCVPQDIRSLTKINKLIL